MNPDLVARVARATGCEPSSWNLVNRGYTDAERWGVRIKDGPAPDEILSDEPELIAMVTGYWASRVGLASSVPEAVRRLQ
jgi:hypothetical protein